MRLGLCLAAVAAAVSIFIGAAMADPAAPRTLTVSGEGEVKAVPDTADLSAGVTTTAATARDALAANSRAMNAVFDTLKRLGTADKDMQTSNFSVTPQYQECKPNAACPRRIAGYQVSNTVDVAVDIGKAGAVLDALVSSGSNQIGGIDFSIRDPGPLLTQARTAAVKDAIDRAETYANAAGVTLGPIQSIQEGGTEAPRPMFKAMETVGYAGAPPPMAAGEETLSANVTIIWAIQ
jgi:uncharacterized protein